MPSGTFYIDGATLATATSVYVDAALTIFAADNFYSDGTIVREQVGGRLVSFIMCPACTVPCGSGITTTSGEGIYSVNVGIGTSVGCFIIYFDPGNIPDGVRAIYDGDYFNNLTSPTYGYLSSGVASNFSYVGRTSDDCGIAAALTGGGYSGLNEYNFNGTTFDLTGTTGSVTGDSGDVNLTVATPGYCTLYVPVLTPTTESILLEVFGVCPTTSGNIEIVCPTLLTGVPTSNVGAASCSSSFPNTYYNVPNRGGTAGEPALHEFFVLDEYASDTGVNNGRVAGGNYTINPPSGKKDIIVSPNGIITSITACP